MARVIVTVGKVKTAVARAVIKKGTGRVIINKRPLEIYEPEYLKMLIEEPLLLAGEDKIKNVDIIVNVRGGGIVGQARAARISIARALVEWYKDEKLKEKFLEYDRYLLIYDPRQREPKKFLGPRARARKQTSYR